MLVELKAVPKLRPLHRVSGAVLSANNGTTDWTADEFQCAAVKDGLQRVLPRSGRAKRG